MIYMVKLGLSQLIKSSRYTQTNKCLLEYTQIPDGLAPLQNLQKVGIMKPLLWSAENELSEDREGPGQILQPGITVCSYLESNRLELPALPKLLLQRQQSSHQGCPGSHLTNFGLNTVLYSEGKTFCVYPWQVFSQPWHVEQCQLLA